VLPEMCIKLHGVNQCRTVLDPFMGTGTTMLAAARLGVAGIGFEISKQYFEEARKALADHRYQAFYGEGE
jgi:site-specific DNA-methyltransferase (adenine-specific)